MSQLQEVIAFLEAQFPNREVGITEHLSETAEVCYGATYDRHGKVIAGALLTLNRYGEKGTHHIHWFAVDAAYRKRGIGRELMQHVLVHVPKNSNISLSCRADNKDALHFYSGLGFKYSRAGWSNRGIKFLHLLYRQPLIRQRK